MFLPNYLEIGYDITELCVCGNHTGNGAIGQRLLVSHLKIDQQHGVCQMLGAICGSALSRDRAAQSMDRATQSVDPYFAQESMNRAGIHGSRRVTKYIYSSTSNRGHHLQLQQHHCRINSYQHSFFPSVVNLWNQLPSDTVGAASLNLFQNRLASLTLR